MQIHSLTRRLLISTLFLIHVLPSCRKSDYNIVREESISDQGGGTGTVTWTRDRDYLLNGFVFVNDGQTLTIESGTVIRAKSGQGSLASALIVARGGRIIAEGERDRPIIFTVEGDDLEGSIPLEARGLWGGVILLGNAGINTPSGEDIIEGIPVSEPRGIYGGPDDNDNSGILRYVSIRHGGTNIGEGNEINGLTLGGVGRQTTIEQVEVISNADDGIEIFGGSVNCRNLCVSFCGDDAFDLDQGYRGKGQFWLGIGDEEENQGLEVDGGLQAVPNLESSFPLLYNLTLITEPGHKGESVIHFANYGGAHLRNSILLDPGKGAAVLYSDRPGDSYYLFRTAKLTLENNVLYPAPEGENGLYTYDEYDSLLEEENAEMAAQMSSWQTDYSDPGISATEGYKLLPSSTEFENMAPYVHEWFETVSYKGAFGSNNWIEGWTLLYESGLVLD